MSLSLVVSYSSHKLNIATFYLKPREYTFFSAPHGTFSKVDHIIKHKTKLNRYKKIVFNHHRQRLDFNNDKNNRKPTYSWKLDNSLLNDNLVRGEIKIKDFIDFNENEETPYPKL